MDVHLLCITENCSSKDGGKFCEFRALHTTFIHHANKKINTSDKKKGCAIQAARLKLGSCEVSCSKETQKPVYNKG